MSHINNLNILILRQYVQPQAMVICWGTSVFSMVSWRYVCRIHEIMNQGPTRELAKQNQSVINDLGCSWQGFPTFVGGKQLGSKLEKTL